MRYVVAAVWVGVLGTSAFAQQGVTWSFTGLSGASTSVPVSAAVPGNATEALPGTVSAITRGAGLTAASGTNVFAANGVNSGVTFNFANNDYFEFTYTAPAVGGVRLNGVTQTLQRITAPSGTQTRWFASTNGVFSSTSTFPTGNAVSGAQSAPGNTSPYNGSGTLSSGLRLNDGQSVTFRLYGWNGGNGSISLNAAALFSTTAYTNTLSTRTWDRNINPGSTSIDASGYSYFNLASYVAGLGANSSATSTYAISAQAGPSTLVEGMDFFFDSSTRVLTLNDTPNVALGTYVFDYTLSVSGQQDGTPFGPSALDTGQISVEVVPAPGTAGLMFAGGILAVRRRRSDCK